MLLAYSCLSISLFDWKNLLLCFGFVMGGFHVISASPELNIQHEARYCLTGKNHEVHFGHCVGGQA